ncbi:mannose-6-phosphate isomerase [Stylonychia lemnae]|uniref:mannose-6-phosphate isomerase n=1 Tax=Stylonychia lemnae TaxID=5949 RepID=A0A078AF22_STYLE|nr:mannose-6-phosphate isomerase [Stylonychia lemnae]|eukprot:CDW80401.1 mannose-6-phosphate isomerase [Stylonychia lemnae]
MDSPDRAALMFLTQQLNRKPPPSRTKKDLSPYQDSQQQPTKPSQNQKQNTINQNLIEQAIKESFRKQSDPSSNDVNKSIASQNDDQKKIQMSRNEENQSMSLSSIKHSKNNSNTMGQGSQDQKLLIDTMASQIQKQQQQLSQREVTNTKSNLINKNSNNYQQQQMQEVKFQFDKSAYEQTPKSLVRNSINEIHELESQRQLNVQIKLENHVGFEDQIQSRDNIQIRSNQSKANMNTQQQSQNSYTPNKLTKFINNSIGQKIAAKNSSSKKRMSILGQALTQRVNKQSNDKINKSRSSSPYNTALKDKPAKEQQIPRINQSRSRTRSKDIVANQPPPIFHKRQSTQTSRGDEQFRQQFMQYLDVLKQKVAEMEFKVRESQNEKNFYKNKYQEQEETMKILRLKETEQSVQIAQLNQLHTTITEKIFKKKNLLKSMQATICSLSVSLEQSRREVKIYKKFNAKQQMNNKFSQFDSPDVIRQNESLSKNDFLSRESSVQKIIDEHVSQSNSHSTGKQNQTALSSTQLDFKSVLRQKLQQLKNNSAIRGSNDDNDFSDNNFDTGYANIVDFEDINSHPNDLDHNQLGEISNKELQEYLDVDENEELNLKREKFKQFNGDIDMFIKFLVKKLHQEQINRLKTEEQSAQVIEQLGKTISRLGQMIKLHCKVQTYAWGKQGLDNYVAKAYLKQVPSIPDFAELLDQAKEDTYAELWIGDHPNGPSQVIIDTHDEQLLHIIDNADFIKHHHGKELSIDQLFRQNPQKFLGQAYLDKFYQGAENSQLNSIFLLKTLAISKALSVQAHPNKTLAQKLHAERPDIYKDPNHKPEIAISLGGDQKFIAYCGFANKATIEANLAQNRALAEALDYNKESSEVSQDQIRKYVSYLFFELDKRPDFLEQIIRKLAQDINELKEDERSLHQKLTLTLVEQYGYKDIGILFVFFLSAVILEEGEAIIMRPDEPHAYVQGDIIECMINSDNVVRGGLTPKLKDVETLSQMLKYDIDKQTAIINPIQISPNITEYKSTYEEFRVFRIKLNNNGKQEQLKFTSFTFAFVIKGFGSCSIDEYGKFQVEEFNAYYILPQIEFTITNETDDELLIFLANCDI